MTAILIGPAPSGGDDTSNLQAFFNTICGNSGVSNYGIIPAGNYTCNSPIVLGATTNVQQGWHIRGAGRGATTINFGAGLAYGIGMNGYSIWRGCKLSDMQLICSSSTTLPIGIKLLDASHSGFQMDNIKFTNFDTSIYSASGGNNNGEFMHVSNCEFENCLTVYYQENGQSYCQIFDSCQIGARANCNLFRLSYASGGGGITLRDVQLSVNSDGVHATNSIMFDLQQNGQPINVIVRACQHMAPHLAM